VKDRGAEGRLQDTWYGERRPGLLLSALERVYAGVRSARRDRTRPDPALEGRPIVVVGNITVGGTGKTPLVMRLCALCAEAGLQTAVVSRGYGRQGSGPVRVDADTSPAQGGDEPVLIARRTGLPVYVDEDREAATKAAFEAGADCVFSDDGLQRASLPRALELCVVDGARGFGNGRLLPAGPLREPVERLESVDWIVSNGDPGDLALPASLRDRLVVMTLAPTTLRRLGSDETLPAKAGPEHLGPTVTAVAGMGHPERFFLTLEALGFRDVHRHAFPDHHDFTCGELEALPGPLVMTGKDAVKCEALGLDGAWRLDVDAVLPPRWEADFLARVRDLTSVKE